MEKKVVLKVPKKKGKKHEHAPVRVSVSKQDSVLWTSHTHEFEIRGIRKDPHAPESHQKPGAPDNPFFRPFPASAKKKGFVSSGPAMEGAVGQQYKSTYIVGGYVIDPHIIISP